MNKKFILVLLFCLFVCLCGSYYDEEKSIDEQLQETVDEQIGGIDWSNIEGVLEDLPVEAQNIFGSISFWDKLNQILSGDFQDDYFSFFQAILKILFSETVNFLPLLSIIVIVTILCSIIGNFRSKEADASVGKLVNFVSFSLVVVLVSSVVISFFVTSKDLIFSMQNQMNAIFPILLTLIASIGGVTSSTIFQPAVAILSNGIVQIFVFALIPLFVFLFVLTVINNLSSSVKLNKLLSFISSVFKWTAGICFSVFLSVLAFQGIVAGSFDGVSIRATKFAVKSYVPIIGSYLSDGFNIVMASSVLIKNVVGFGGILLLGATILTPVISIIVCSLMLKLSSAILEPIGETSTVSNFLNQISKMLSLLVMMIVGVSFLYAITIGLILGTANVF